MLFFGKYLFVSLLTVSSICTAQVGIKMAMLTPTSDVAKYYKRGAAAELYGVFRDGRNKVRTGLMYGKIDPRPGTSPGKRLLLLCFAADYSRRLIPIHDFSIHGGVGVMMGRANPKISGEMPVSGNPSYYEPDVVLFGLRLCGIAEYRISHHITVYSEYSHNVTTGGYDHNLLSLGVDYNFKPLEK